MAPPQRKVMASGHLLCDNCPRPGGLSLIWMRKVLGRDNGGMVYRTVRCLLEGKLR